MKNIKAVSIIEFIICLTILAVLLTMVFTVMAKKAKIIIPENRGIFVCWKDNQNNLLQKTFSINPNNIVNETPVKKVESCEIEFDKEKYNRIKKYTVTLIGGGGGGAQPSFKDADINKYCTYKYVNGASFYPYEIKNGEVYRNEKYIKALKDALLFDLIPSKYPEAFAYDSSDNSVKFCSISNCSNSITECKNDKCKDKISDYKILVDKNSVFAPFGTRGEDAPLNVLNNLFLTGDKVLIKNEDIASFTDINSDGGATKLLVEDELTQTRTLKAMVSGGKKGKIINDFNQIVLPEITADISSGMPWKGITNNKFISDSSMYIYNTYGTKYTGEQGAYCDNAMICNNAENIEKTFNIVDIDKNKLNELKSIFGKGGGGASGVIRCPYITDLKYTKPQFKNGNLILNNLVSDTNSSINDGNFKNANASKGSGGAIIIEWE